MRILCAAHATNIAPELATDIAETTAFSQVSVAIANPQGLDLVGQAGLTEAAAAGERQTLSEISISQLQAYCASAESVAAKSFRLPAHALSAGEGKRWP